MTKSRVRVTKLQFRSVPIFKYEHSKTEDGQQISKKTDEIIRTDSFCREILIFSGSEKAFKIFSRVADITGCKTERTLRHD